MKIRDFDLVSNIGILFENKIIVWGGGYYGELTVELLDDMGLTICGVYDKNKQGKYILGHIISDADVIKEQNDETRTIIIVSSAKYAEEMLKDISDFGICPYGVYTYGGLKIAVELNIRSEIIDESFRRTFLQMRKAYVKDFQYRHAGDLMRQWVPNLLLKNNTGLLVFSPPKVGSSSLTLSLNLIGTPAVWVHGFSQKDQQFKRYLQEKEKIVKIITLVREPIAKGISGFFHFFGDEYNMLAYWNDGRMQRDICNGLRKHLLMQCEAKNGETSIRSQMEMEEFSWFDVHLRELTGIDIFQYPFDREKGYGLIKEGKWEMLLLKTESLNENSEVIGNFVGVKDFKLVNDNVGSEKIYKYLYADVKEKLTIPREVIDYYYNGNERMDHFYTEEQKAAVKAGYRIDE